MQEYLKRFKKRKSNKMHKNTLKNHITKFLVAIIIFLSICIIIKYNNNVKVYIKEHIYNNSLNFMKNKNIYEKVFGEVLIQDNVKTVSGEKINYQDITKYYDGFKLDLTKSTVINSINSGIVVFIGNKKNYGNTIIIQGIDGIDIWYGNIENTNLKLYDYIEKGKIIGNTIDNYLYLVLRKDNEYIDYETYKV